MWSRQRQLARVGKSCLLVLGLIGVACGPAPVRTPNVILVSLDTLRADHTGLYGSSLETTPFLDRLSRDAVVFDRAITQCSHTVDSHMSLLQSRYPTRTSTEAATLAEVLQAHGFTTVAFTGGGLVSPELGFARGFDRYDSYPAGFVDSLPAARTWIAELPDDHSPFFMFLHSYDIHAPYTAPAKFVDLFVKEPYEGPIRPEETHAYQRHLLGLGPPRPGLMEVEWNAVDRAYFEALYDAGVRETDEALGTFLKWLDGRRSWDWSQDLLVIFSDHGEEFWDHGSVGHGSTLYQELLWVPLVFRLPAAAQGGTRIERTVELMDVSPTILDIVGIERPASFFGESLMPLITGKGPLPSEIAASLTVRGYRSIIDYPWKLILSHPEGVEMLFNLEEDPWETSPLGTEHAMLAEQLRLVLEATLEGEIVRREIVDPATIEDPELLKQLRSLGYLE
jgi:arylsulfatase A-like enzyme